MNVKFFDWDYLHLTALMKETYFSTPRFENLTTSLHKTSFKSHLYDEVIYLRYSSYKPVSEEQVNSFFFVRNIFIILTQPFPSFLETEHNSNLLNSFMYFTSLAKNIESNFDTERNKYYVYSINFKYKNLNNGGNLVF